MSVYIINPTILFEQSVNKSFDKALIQKSRVPRRQKLKNKAFQ